MSKIGPRPARLLFYLFAGLSGALGIAILASLAGSALDAGLATSAQRLAHDEQLLAALRRTILLLAASAGLQLAIAAFATAFFTSAGTWIKLLLVVPFAVGTAAPGFAALVFLSSAVGPLNLNVLGNPLGASVAIVFVDTWQWLGVLLLSCFAVLERVRPSQYEQARLEGIGRARRWWMISRPRLQSLFVIYLLVRFFDWLRKVDLIRALFGDGGGPGLAAETAGAYVAKIFYWPGSEGYAAFLSLLQLASLALFLSIVARADLLGSLIGVGEHSSDD